MSSAANSRWSDKAMLDRVRRRYAAERRFRMLGFSAIGISVLFLAFLLFTMGSKGIGGFTQHEAALPLDFTTTDLFLDPATLRGPEAEQAVASADLEARSHRPQQQRTATKPGGCSAKPPFANSGRRSSMTPRS
jgi:phosphate transport system permease protein